MIYQSGDLSAFYLAILNWIETGESVFPFDHRVGLCGNTYMFVGNGNYCKARMLIEEMKHQFHQAKLDVNWPFNTGEDAVHYKSERNKYQNPKRLQWIKDHAII